MMSVVKWSLLKWQGKQMQMACLQQALGLDDLLNEHTEVQNLQRMH